jgi:2,3-bisphosphoglycerate-dependent phosphoglycerate mutase
MRLGCLVGVLFLIDISSAFVPTPTRKAYCSQLQDGTNGEANGDEDNRIQSDDITQPLTSNGSTHVGNRNYEGFKMINNGYTGNTGGYHVGLDARGQVFSKIFGAKQIPPSTLADQEENEDGWKEMRKKSENPLWKTLLKMSNRALFPKPPVEPGTLILVRHGESVWNANKTFTGWADPDLSDRGEREVEHAARLLLEGGYEIDVVFTSRLKRAIRSVWIILQEMNQVYLPVFKSWRLNERMYGALTGLCKSETAEQLGAELVQEWRGSLRSRPPALKPSDAYWPGRDRKYADLSMEQIPLTESLSDCMERCQPIWEQKIMYELRSGRNVMVVAHANTLRGLVKTIDEISDQDIQDVAIPTGYVVFVAFCVHGGLF